MPPSDPHSSSDKCGNITSELLSANDYNHSIIPAATIYQSLGDAHDAFLPDYVDVVKLKVTQSANISDLISGPLSVWLKAEKIPGLSVAPLEPQVQEALDTIESVCAVCKDRVDGIENAADKLQDMLSELAKEAREVDTSRKHRRPRESTVSDLVKSIKDDDLEKWAKVFEEDEGLVGEMRVGLKDNICKEHVVKELSEAWARVMWAGRSQRAAEADALAEIVRQQSCD